MSGKGHIIAIVSVGVGLGGLILNGQRTTNEAMAGLREDVAGVRQDVAELRERMARLEVLFEGFVRRKATE